ncbi:MAG: ABC transporter substrate-binding protein [Pseudomonadota bacterium]
MDSINKQQRRNINTQTRRVISSSILALYSLFALPILSYANLDSPKVIAITEIVAHPSLEQAKLGIIDSLKNAGYKPGINLKIIEQNAQGNISNASLIAKNFVALKPDAIVAISTPSAQSIVRAIRGTDIPLVISSVTDPVSAGIVTTIESPTMNITGSIDTPLIPEEIELIKQMVPGIKTLGLLYSSGEDNSAKTIELIKSYLNGKMEIREAIAMNSNQVSGAIASLVGKVDAVYIPSG